MRRIAAIFALALLAPPLPSQDASPAQLERAVSLISRRDGSTALTILRPLARRYPAIADYIAFWTAQALVLENDHAAAVQAVETVFRQQPESPLTGRAALLAASSLLELNNPRGALTMLTRVQESQLPQPDSLAVLARAREAVGDPVAAALAWQSIHFAYPSSAQAKDAGPALARLEATLGATYPPPMPSSRFDRAEKLLRASRFRDARNELLRMIPLLDGPTRETAQVRAAASLHRAREDRDAFAELSTLSVQDPDAAAERLHWLAAAARRLDRPADMEQALKNLASAGPASEWRLNALISAGDGYLVDNRVSDYVPHYSACAEALPSHPRAPYCHWKVVWAAWLSRSPNAVRLLQDHLRLFPASDKAGAALYWLAQAARSSGDTAAARHYLAELNAHFPNYFYAVLARDILARPDMRNGAKSSTAQAFLASLKLPDRDRAPDFSISPSARVRIDRGRLLRQAGLESWAETELRFAARNGDSPWALAIELSETAYARGDYARSIRYIIGTVPGYLFLPREAAPERFWRLAFPFPYRASITKYARERGIDPFLLAALIRQESLFDHGVVSSAGAVGLTQVMPPTGRQLARRLKLRYTYASLKRADFNLRLGSFYLGNLIKSFDGNIEDALAAYNAGPNRPPKWRQWGDFRYNEEFIETIPFTQTRDYVQIILRNADVYRWLYSGTPVPAEPAVKPTKKSTPAGKPARKSSRPTKRK
ncbi:MAG: hypothetical protein C0504_08770 [Candidatus Solibacter sp.]|nr:hypothetical protein [Candidatus Solibacter sp.]